MIQRVLRWSVLDYEDNWITETIVCIGIICFLTAAMIPFYHRYVDVSRLSEAHIWSGGLRLDYHLNLLESNPSTFIVDYYEQSQPSSILNIDPVSDTAFSLEFDPRLFYYPISQINWQLIRTDQSSTTGLSAPESAYQWLSWQCQLNSQSINPKPLTEQSIQKQKMFASMLLCPASASKL